MTIYLPIGPNDSSHFQFEHVHSHNDAQKHSLEKLGGESIAAICSSCNCKEDAEADLFARVYISKMSIEGPVTNLASLLIRRPETF